MDTPIKPPVLTSSSLAGASNVLFSFEKSDESKSKSKPKPKPKPQEPVVVKPKSCKTCQKKGHSWKECPTPDINKKCSNCQKIGHIAQSCKIIMVSFAKYQPPKPEPRPPRERNNNNFDSNQRGKFNNKSMSADSTATTAEASDIVVSNGSPKNDSTSPKPATPSPKNQSPKLSSAKSSPVPPIVVPEQLKLTKDVLSRQLFIANPPTGWTIPDNLPEVARQSAVASVCLPALVNQEGKLDISVTKCIKSLHSYGIQAPLCFEMNSSVLLADHPDWCQSANPTALCAANTEFQSYFTKLFGDCLKQLIEMKTDIGPMDGFYIELPAASDDKEEAVSSFKQNLLFMIKDINTLDKTKKQPANKPIHQIVYFNSTKPEKVSNILKLPYQSESEFSIFSRYQYQIPVINEVSINVMNSNSFKTYDTIWFECSKSLILSNRCSIRVMANQLSNKYCLPMIEKLYKTIIDKEMYFKNAKMVCDVGVVAPSSCPPAVLNALTSMLNEFNYQFNFIQQPISSMDFVELCKYRVLILPDQPCMSGDGWTSLQKFISKGGSVLVTGDASLDSQTSNFSITTAGMKYTKQSGCTQSDCLSVVEKKGSKSVSIQDNNYKLAMLQLSGRSGNVESTSNDTISLLDIAAGQADETAQPAVLYSTGQRTIYCVHPLFGQYWEQGDRAICDLFRSMMRIILPDPVVNLGAQPMRSLHTFVTHQQVAPTKTVEPLNRYIVHMLNADTVAVGGKQCHEVAKDLKHVTFTINAPKDQTPETVVATGDIEKEACKYKIKGNQITIEMPTLTKHTMIIINFKQIN